MKRTIRSVKRAEMFTFKRWGRKAYSLFSVMKKPVRIGVLLAVYNTVTEPEFTFAQTDSSKVSMEYNLDEVEVSAQRAPVVFSQVARIVSVIGREEIEAAPVQSIQELLEYALSVDVRQRGGSWSSGRHFGQGRFVRPNPNPFKWRQHFRPPDRPSCPSTFRSV